MQSIDKVVQASFAVVGSSQDLMQSLLGHVTALDAMAQECYQRMQAAEQPETSSGFHPAYLEYRQKAWDSGQSAQDYQVWVNGLVERVKELDVELRLAVGSTREYRIVKPAEYEEMRAAQAKVKELEAERIDFDKENVERLHSLIQDISQMADVPPNSLYAQRLRWIAENLPGLLADRKRVEELEARNKELESRAYFIQDGRRGESGWMVTEEEYDRLKAADARIKELESRVYQMSIQLTQRKLLHDQGKLCWKITDEEYRSLQADKDLLDWAQEHMVRDVGYFQDGKKFTESYTFRQYLKDAKNTYDSQLAQETAREADK